MSANHLPMLSLDSSVQPIELGWSHQRLALRDYKEDWTGITSPAERRKLQNRLNQRVRRKRARQKTSCEATADEDGTPAPSQRAFSISPGVSGSSRGSSVELAPQQSHPRRCMASIPEVQALMNRFADHAYASYMQGKPAIAHLPLLVRYNVAMALAANASLLGVTEEFFNWEGVSPMNKQGPLLGLSFRNQFADWPASLKPTPLQLSMGHHPWVDCFPWPRLRNNLLKAFEHTDICDEDELCHDISDYKDAAGEPMLIIWGSPWDPRSWEVSDEFLAKWAWLLKGCGDIIVATNHWRAQRGEEGITPQQFAEFVSLSLPKRLSLGHDEQGTAGGKL